MGKLYCIEHSGTVEEIDVYKRQPHVHLGLDIGWVYVAGFDPADIILKYGKRINYVHLRDLTLANVEQSLPFSAVHQTLFEAIGKGNAPLKEILMLLDDCMDKNGWATIEYEFGEDVYKRQHCSISLQAFCPQLQALSMWTEKR